jgi:hypothetical protein
MVTQGTAITAVYRAEVRCRNKFGMTTERTVTLNLFQGPAAFPVTLNSFQGPVSTCRRCRNKFGMMSTAKSIRFSADFITCIPH